MKVSIIGGGGLVGSSAAFALQCGGRGQPDRPDRPERRPGARARPSTCSTAPRSSPTSGSAPPATRRSPRATSLITAGLRRKPDESRLDLINRNVELFLNILGQVKAAGLEARRDRAGRLQPGRRLDLPGRRASSACRRRQVIGLGTQLDTARFRSLIAEALELPAHAGDGPDPRRARRQHGPDLVGRAGRRAAAREVPRLELERRPRRSSPAPAAAAPR